MSPLFLLPSVGRALPLKYLVTISHIHGCDPEPFHRHLPSALYSRCLLADLSARVFASLQGYYIFNTTVRIILLKIWASSCYFFVRKPSYFTQCLPILLRGKSKFLLWPKRPCKCARCINTHTHTYTHPYPWPLLFSPPVLFTPTLSSFQTCSCLRAFADAVPSSYISLSREAGDQLSHLQTIVQISPFKRGLSDHPIEITTTPTVPIIPLSFIFSDSSYLPSAILFIHFFCWLSIPSLRSAVRVGIFLCFVFLIFLPAPGTMSVCALRKCLLNWWIH